VIISGGGILPIIAGTGKIPPSDMITVSLLPSSGTARTLSPGKV